VCKHLRIDEEAFRELLAEAAGIPGVRHLFVSSGLRMDLLLRTPKLLTAIIARHTPGALKVAPEHTDPEVLRLMHKPGPEVLEQFLARVQEVAAHEGKRVAVNPYLIASHPGCTTRHMEHLARDLARLKLPVRQFQDFTPTPGTIATAMYVSGLDRETRQPIPVAKRASERAAQRAKLEGAMAPFRRSAAKPGTPAVRRPAKKARR
jgi:radical SAM superfamily enzyme YgiQ (UPF0313 family)